MIPSDTIKTAHGKIKSYIRETPVLHAREFHDLEVHLKLENFQVTGSFKARGGLNKLCSLTDADRNKGIVTASSGNHGAAVSFGANALGCEAHVFVPEGADPSKIAAIRSYGATVDTHGHDCSLTEAHARQTANATGKTYVSPYNDLDVIAGQGTIAVELQSQAAKLDAIFVSVGGGGLIGGIGSYIKRHSWARYENHRMLPGAVTGHACLPRGRRNCRGALLSHPVRRHRRWGGARVGDLRSLRRGHRYIHSCE